MTQEKIDLFLKQCAHYVYVLNKDIFLFKWSYLHYALLNNYQMYM